VLPDNVEAARITLRPERIAGASYRYVHGLEQHQGNCQRIAHGHRSRIEIYRDGARNEASERWLAERWRDIYIGSRDHLAGETCLEGQSCYRFAYHAPQGEFELVLDKRRCELLDTASTIENIAEHIAMLLGQRDPAARYRVRAYEGIRKGAIAEA
jgi:6-pyruvoyl-tetrahydropterin synthase